MRSWLWLSRKVGARRAIRYWWIGTQRGWMDEATARAWIEAVIAETRATKDSASMETDQMAHNRN
jgi:hypothetical protein